MAFAGLMDLPTEVRLYILREAFIFKGQYLWQRRFYLSGLGGLRQAFHGALLANRQLRREALTILFGDPLWRIVTNAHSWEISQDDIHVLLALLETGDLTLARRFRFEFDLEYDSQTGTRLPAQVKAAYTGMTLACDLLTQARGPPLEVEVGKSFQSPVPFLLYCLSCFKTCFAA